MAHFGARTSPPHSGHRAGRLEPAAETTARTRTEARSPVFHIFRPGTAAPRVTRKATSESLNTMYVVPSNSIAVRISVSPAGRAGSRVRLSARTIPRSVPACHATYRRTLRTLLTLLGQRSRSQPAASASGIGTTSSHDAPTPTRANTTVSTSAITSFPPAPTPPRRWPAPPAGSRSARPGEHRDARAGPRSRTPARSARPRGTPASRSGATSRRLPRPRHVRPELRGHARRVRVVERTDAQRHPPREQARGRRHRLPPGAVGLQRDAAEALAGRVRRQSASVLVGHFVSPLPASHRSVA